jgi:hypothetical protein
MDSNKLPDAIWLQIGPDYKPEDGLEGVQWSEVTHSLHKIYEHDLHYRLATPAPEGRRLFEAVPVEDPPRSTGYYLTSNNYTDKFNNLLWFDGKAWFTDIPKYGGVPCFSYLPTYYLREVSPERLSSDSLKEDNDKLRERVKELEEQNMKLKGILQMQHICGICKQPFGDHRSSTNQCPDLSSDTDNFLETRFQPTGEY